MWLYIPSILPKTKGLQYWYILLNIEDNKSVTSMKNKFSDVIEIAFYCKTILWFLYFILLKHTKNSCLLKKKVHEKKT